MNIFKNTQKKKTDGIWCANGLHRDKTKVNKIAVYNIILGFICI